MLEFQMQEEEPGTQMTAKSPSRRPGGCTFPTRPRRAARSDGECLVYDEHFEAGIRQIRDILGGLGIPYHFTGGLAASFYGEPRFTQDVDLVIHLSADIRRPKPCCNDCPQRYLADRRSSWMRSVGRASSRLSRTRDRVLKIDFHVGEKIPGELQRTHATGDLAPVSPSRWSPRRTRSSRSCSGFSGKREVQARRDPDAQGGRGCRLGVSTIAGLELGRRRRS